MSIKIHRVYSKLIQSDNSYEDNTIQSIKSVYSFLEPYLASFGLSELEMKSLAGVWDQGLHFTTIAKDINCTPEMAKIYYQNAICRILDVLPNRDILSDSMKQRCLRLCKELKE